MKLFIFDGGRALVPDMSRFTSGQNIGLPVIIPFPMFLIDHPEGLVVFDTGINMDNLPEVFKEETTSSPEQRIDRQMMKLGYEPENVKYVILSHLHLDHAGGMTFFPNATFIVRQEEMRAAWWPEEDEKAYVFADYKDTRGYRYLHLKDDEQLDVFDDGTLVLFDTSGHTRGHQSAIIKLPKSGTMVLAADAAQVGENLSKGYLPGGCWNTAMAARSIKKLQHLEKEGAKIICGHDLPTFEQLRLAPEWYE
jgi:N-acyl homoserine lactone hydrolase